MKRHIFFFIITFFSVSGFLFAATPDFSGVLDSTVNYTAGAGDAEAHSFGIEEYANIRLRLRTGEKAIFNAAFNIVALSGNYALLPVASGMAVNGHNYAMGMELERLYLRINGDLFDTEAGLLRMNFGYGMVWGSSDFLNPRNPLAQNARPRGVLGVNVSYYPTDTLKMLFFAAAPKNPFQSDGGGYIPGLTIDQHWERASVQGLYAYELPGSSSETSLADPKHGLHRFGFSLKADIELGFVADVLYTLNPNNPGGIDGLSAGVGFDYTFLAGDLFVLTEYLYNGASSVTALGSGGSFSNRHYLSASALYRFSEYSSLTLSTVFCFDDLSFQPIASFDYELFQGFSMNLTARFPLDQKVLGGGKAGELGPIPPFFDENGDPVNKGSKLIFNAGVRLRF